MSERRVERAHKSEASKNVDRFGAPGVLEYILDCDPAGDVSVEHEPNEIDAVLAQDKGDAQVMVHDLVDAVEWVLFVDDGV